MCSLILFGLRDYGGWGVQLVRSFRWVWRRDWKGATGEANEAFSVIKRIFRPHTADSHTDRHLPAGANNSTLLDLFLQCCINDSACLAGHYGMNGALEYAGLNLHQHLTVSSKHQHDGQLTPTICWHVLRPLPSKRRPNIQGVLCGVLYLSIYLRCVLSRLCVLHWTIDSVYSHMALNPLQHVQICICFPSNASASEILFAQVDSRPLM